MKEIINFNSNIEFGECLARSLILLCYRVESDGIHKRCDYPFLHYAGAGVHIPDSNETPLNFRVLLNNWDDIIF